jgi:hypothetical protein
MLLVRHTCILKHRFNQTKPRRGHVTFFNLSGPPSLSVRVPVQRSTYCEAAMLCKLMELSSNT